MMNDEMLHYVDKSVLCWLATIDEGGCPNVSPKEIFCACGQSELLIANIASPGSMSNIQRNPLVCVSFVDVFVQKGFKVKGEARVIDSTQREFVARAEPLARMAGERFPFASLFVVNVTRVEPIVAPSYRLYLDTVESVQVASAMKAYGVRATGF
ncbi:pyridoxamine 5'-phosphate oxidase family protein [Paraburkholderia sp. BCC1876]|uniref:pyridoxamine 5'-phosphate oxidase family protein n=1 Tax=Paraburkholderia sp. BCC1876 TaxID=2676303 RepID=UPI001590282A|nr:pyridoxamine 5'-phosphate oxidase family protein [Paraburkholderia sp. BCC1876]